MKNKFEYKILQLEFPRNPIKPSGETEFWEENVFNPLGEEGWELITIDKNLYCYFKRCR